jgi:hypothetical protein
MMASYNQVAGAVAGTIIDDSGDSEYRQYLFETYPDWQVYAVADAAAGYWPAMKCVWAIASQHEFVFFVEDDFVFTRPVSLHSLQSFLERNPTLAQVVLLRQPWFPNEIEAGGVVNALAKRGEYVISRSDMEGDTWIQHLATWSGNPTLFRGADWVRHHPWPGGEGSEYRFGRELVSQGYSFAYWGDGTEYVEHIGQRTGFGH